jgi:hypothetical protein
MTLPFRPRRKMDIATNRLAAVLRSFAELRRAPDTKIAYAVASPAERMFAFQCQ